MSLRLAGAGVAMHRYGEALPLLVNLAIVSTVLMLQYQAIPHGLDSYRYGGAGTIPLMLFICQVPLLTLLPSDNDSQRSLFTALFIPPAGPLSEGSAALLSILYFWAIGTIEYSSTLYKPCEQADIPMPGVCSDRQGLFVDSMWLLRDVNVTGNCTPAMHAISAAAEQPWAAAVSCHWAMNDKRQPWFANTSSNVSWWTTFDGSQRLVDFCCASCVASSFESTPHGCQRMPSDVGCESQPHMNHNPWANEVVEPLTLIDGLYFSVVITTTVGYGHAIVPVMPAGRLFTMYYSITGLVIFAIVSAKLWTVCDAMADEFKRRAPERRWWTPKVTPHTSISPRVCAQFEQAKAIFRLFVTFVVLNFVSAAIFTALQPEWHFFDAIYHSMMTASTVGLGDIGPTTQSARAFAIVHMIASVILFANLIGTVAEVVAISKQARKQETLLEKQLDPGLVTSLDVSGDGKLDKAEFALGMIVKLGLIEQADVQPFLERFDELDSDGSGSLDVNDLANDIAGRAAVSAKKQSRFTVDGVNEELYEALPGLILFAGLACVQFLWCTWFGWMLLLSGLLDGVIVGMTMTMELGSRELVHLTLIALLTLCTWLITVVGQLAWMLPWGNPYYTRIDEFAALTFGYGYLKDGMYSTLDREAYVALDSKQGLHDATQRRLQDYEHRVAWPILMSVYFVFYFLAIGLHLRFVYIVNRARWKAKRAPRQQAVGALYMTRTDSDEKSSYA